jgi:Aspartyl protease
MKSNLSKITVGMLLASLIGIVAWIQFEMASTRATQTVIPFEAESPKKHVGAKEPTDQLASVTTIPFTLTASNNIAVPVTVNQGDNLILMFHSAVDSVTVTNDALKKLHNFKTDEVVEVQSWGGTASGTASKGNRLKIGAFEWKDQTIFVDQFSGPGTDGKFGPNLFDGKVLEINFDRSELVIHSSLPSFAIDRESNYQRLDFSMDRGAMYVAGELVIGEEKFPNKFMIHSGFSGTVVLDDAFVKEREVISKLPTISERELKDAFGNVVKTKKVRLTAMRFGELHFDDVPVEIFDGTVAMQQISILGGDFLKRFNMIIDSTNHCLYVSLSKYCALEFGE